MPKDHKPMGTKDLMRREARRLFVAKGYNGVAMRDIGAAVGVRQSAIYNHFRNKQDILVDLMSSHMEAVLAAQAEALADIQGPAARLDAFVRFHTAYHIDHPEDVFLAFMELRSLEPEMLGAVTEKRNRYEATLREILSAGRADGSFRIADAAIHARALLAMMTGLASWYQEGGRLARTEIIDCYAQAARQSVGCAGS